MLDVILPTLSLNSQGAFADLRSLMFTTNTLWASGVSGLHAKSTWRQGEGDCSAIWTVWRAWCVKSIWHVWQIGRQQKNNGWSDFDPWCTSTQTLNVNQTCKMLDAAQNAKRLDSKCTHIGLEASDAISTRITHLVWTQHYVPVQCGCSLECSGAFRFHFLGCLVYFNSLKHKFGLLFRKGSSNLQGSKCIK